jgi:polyhydroxyalkanoate synthesis regulator phasin
MKDVLEKAIAVGFGLAAVGKEQAEKFVDELVRRGELTKAESQPAVEELMRKGREAQASLEEKVRGCVRQALADMRLTTRDDYAGLAQRVEQLERRVAELEGRQAPSDGTPPPAGS